MSKEIPEYMNGEVTKESVVLYTKDIDEPYAIEGIPEGFSWKRKMNKKHGDYYTECYLLGFTPDYQWKVLGAAFYKPVVYKKDATKEEIVEEFKRAEEGMIEIYKENVRNRK